MDIYLNLIYIFTITNKTISSVANFAFAPETSLCVNALSVDIAYTTSSTFVNI